MTKSAAGKALALSAAVLAASVPSREAHAVDVGTVISGVKTAYDAYKKYTNTQLTLDQATTQILGAINSAKGEILKRIEGLAAAQGAACTKSAIIAFQGIKTLTETSKEQLAKDSLDCLTLIEAYLEEVDDKAAVDKLGFALNALGPIVLMSHAHADIEPSPLITDAIQNGNFAVIAKLHPPCHVARLEGDEDQPTQYNIRCTAYNLEQGFAHTWTGDPERLNKRRKAENDATRNTSRKLAQAVQPVVPNL